MSNIHLWARIIKTYDEIPDGLKEKCIEEIGQRALLPYIIYSPSDRWGSRYTNERLTCLLEDRITVIEKTENGMTAVSYMPQNINYLRRRSILLHSWLSIAGVAGNKAAITTIEYNTVVKNLFIPIINFLRPLPGLKENTDGSSAGLESFDCFKELEYRFRQYARECIAPGEEVLAMCFQPVIYEKRRRFIRKMLSNSHLSILTGREWIFINEGELISAKSQKYEDIYTFIALDKIRDVTADKLTDTLNVKLAFKDAGELTMMFDTSKKAELDSFIRTFRKLKTDLKAK